MSQAGLSAEYLRGRARIHELMKFPLAKCYPAEMPKKRRYSQERIERYVRDGRAYRRAADASPL